MTTLKPDNLKTIALCSAVRRAALLLCLIIINHNASAGIETYDGVEYNVVYIDVDSGKDTNDGSNPDKAVLTWSRAYQLLPAYTGTTEAERDEAWDHNIIVVCDKTSNMPFRVNEEDANGKPATITGVWPWTEENTTGEAVRNGGKIVIYTVNQNGDVGQYISKIGADTKFKYLRFGSWYNSAIYNYVISYLSMYLHDLTFDAGCCMDDIQTYLKKSNGAMNDNSSPDLHIMIYADNNDFTDENTKWPNPTKPAKLTIRSGKFGRILSTRASGTTPALIKQRYVIGTPDHPLLGIMDFDVDPVENAKYNTKFNDCPDVSFCCAGSTQGTEYCDIQYNIKRAKIGKLVAATQGMNIIAAENNGISCSTFIGRTVINLIPEGWENGTANNDDIEIEEYYGACLGRSGTIQGTCNAAFYGKSQLNMYGGKIKAGAYLSAGGISGLRSPDGKYYTTDKFVPYPDNNASYAGYPFNGIKYQVYDANKTIVDFTTRMNGTEEHIDLANTTTEFNIYGGVINGGLYGGSYGYSEVLGVAYTLADAGCMWGTTNVNIYGGTITGGVYGGGYGSSNYYNLATAVKRNNFLSVASVYGNTNVNIYGGNISGGIYGGGKGVDAQEAGTKKIPTVDNNWTNIEQTVTTVKNEFPDIAKVYGNTNVTIAPTDPNWTYDGNIYGGGAMGAVEGNTNVTIKGGIINGKVFGAGQGEEGHPNKAKVTGNTNVTVGEEE